MRLSKFAVVATLLLIFIQPVGAQDIEYLSTQPWDHSPITVFINEVNIPEHYSPTYREQVEIALEYWEQGGNRKLSYTPEFQIVDDRNADINIKWIKTLRKLKEHLKELPDTLHPYL